MASGIMYVYDILSEIGDILIHTDITRLFDTRALIQYKDDILPV